MIYPNEIELTFPNTEIYEDILFVYKSLDAVKLKDLVIKLAAKNNYVPSFTLQSIKDERGMTYDEYAFCTYLAGILFAHRLSDGKYERNWPRHCPNCNHFFEGTAE